MQIYTHILVGSAIGVSLTQMPSEISLCALGGVFPDIPIALLALVDIAQKKPPLLNEKEEGPWFTLKEISHSPLWFLGFLTVSSGSLFFYFLLGWSSHWVIDVLTHASPRFLKTDQSLAWPFYQWGFLPKLGTTLGLWEYRNKLGTLKPKIFELGLCLVLLGFIVFKIFSI